MAELTANQNDHVQNLITHIMGKKGIDKSEAIQKLHLFVCKGTCSWYKDSGGTGTKFDITSQRPQHLDEMRKLIDDVAEGRNVTRKELMSWFHIFRCHS